MLSSQPASQPASRSVWSLLKKRGRSFPSFLLFPPSLPPLCRCCLFYFTLFLTDSTYSSSVVRFSQELQGKKCVSVICVQNAAASATSGFFLSQLYHHFSLTKIEDACELSESLTDWQTAFAVWRWCLESSNKNKRTQLASRAILFLFKSPKACHVATTTTTTTYVLKNRPLWRQAVECYHDKNAQVQEKLGLPWWRRDSRNNYSSCFVFFGMRRKICSHV